METQDRTKMVTGLRNLPDSGSNHGSIDFGVFDNTSAVHTKDFQNVKEKTVYKYLLRKGMNQADAQRRANDLIKVRFKFYLIYVLCF